MAGLRQMGLPRPWVASHLQRALKAGHERPEEQSLIMIALTRSLASFGRALGVVGAAISAAAAIRITHQPDMRKTALAD